MGKKIVVGPLNKGLRNDVTAFNIDDDSFPNLINAYQWRSRVKRKRGTKFLNRLTRYFNSANPSYGSIASFNLVNNSGNLLTGFGLEPGNIVIGSINIVVNAITYTDPSMDGTLTGGSGGTINYSNGVIFIVGGGTNAVTGFFLYYPNLPVMGLEDLILDSNDYPLTLDFDTKYSYFTTPSDPATVHDISFYKNPATGFPLYTSYVHKTVVTPTWWNGKNYQQFWTVNYQGSLWATNGVTTPFSPGSISNIGMPFNPINTVTVNTTTTATLNFALPHKLVVGDFLFINEVVTTIGINFQTGYVTTRTDANNVIVTFPNATITTNGTGGIAQYLTSRFDTTKDCLRWYDGDPTNASATAPVLNGENGWVNFCPPLSEDNYSISDLPQRQYYLVGAKMIVPFKDRLLFFAPVVQASNGDPIYLKDTVIYSQHGSPYYTASFTGDVIDVKTKFFPILVPQNQTAQASAYFEDQTGFGGFVQAGIDQEITTVETNEDLLLVGFPRLQSRFTSTGNAIPFEFFTVNDDLGSGSTFSSINMGKGVITRGSRGYILTSQVGAQRIDTDVPDQVFQINSSNNGVQRVCAYRDYINEWINFTYPSNEQDYIFPNQTLFYNYRDSSWAIFNEAYTTYGLFRQQSGETWATLTVETWSSWNDDWDSGETTLFNPDNIAGNQQGFVVKKDEGTSESISLTINSIAFQRSIVNPGVSQAANAVITVTSNFFAIGEQVTINGVVGMTELNGNTYTVVNVTLSTITIDIDSTLFTAYISGGTVTPVKTFFSPNHCLNEGDYIIINNVLGALAPFVNGKIFSVSLPTNDGFDVSPPIGVGVGNYQGGGTITRLYVPQIQSKQFPIAWSMGRKTRIGVQQYLLTTTAISQITLQIFLSQNADFPYNDNAVAFNDSLVYSAVLYTCPESTNLGLTPANINLNMVTAQSQSQTWHRINTSLIGDTVQVGFTMSEAQMRAIDEDGEPINAMAEIELHGFILDVTESMILA